MSALDKGVLMTVKNDSSSKVAPDTTFENGDNSEAQLWEESTSNLPAIAFALHGGNLISAQAAEELILNQSDRRREEDPYTGLLSSIAPTRLNIRHSRFEVDLNRQRDEAIYPPEVWGLRVWDKEPSKKLAASSLQKYDAFYGRAKVLLDDMSGRYPKFLVLDLHSYNHRRQGPYSPAEPPELNPEINIGTGNVDRPHWGHVIDQFMGSLSQFNYHGRNLDVRENVRFRGGHFSAWVQENYGAVACTLAIEVKKFFMNEWTDELYFGSLDSVRSALRQAVLETSKAL